MRLNNVILRDNLPLKSQNGFFSNIRLHFGLKKSFSLEIIADKMTLGEFSSELTPSLVLTTIYAEYTFF